ncbi:MAG: hypothetical protein ABI131_11365 [Nostocoides sp.]
MNTQILPETAAVAAYVQGVRSALGDLPAEDVDDLTSGMEADLAEALTEGAGDLTTRFGTPEAYAAELRSAAGLPPATTEGSTPVTVRSRLSATRDGWLQRHSTLADVGRELAPLWWLGRGLGAAYLASAFFGTGRIPAALVFVAASLWLGYRTHQDKAQPTWPRTVDRLWSVGGLILVPIAVWLVLVPSAAAYGGGSSGATEYSAPGGLALDGNQVQGLYAYGPDGKRLDNVRLFADDGRPITVLSDGVPQSPWVDQAGRQWSNVFPSINPYSQGWTVRDPNAWHPPMTIDPLVQQVPDQTDSTDPSPGVEGAPTEATPGSTSTTALPTSTAPPGPTK